MSKQARRFLLVAAAAALALTFTAQVALAVSPPVWVAVIFVQAQKSVGLRWNPAAGATGYKVLRSTVQGKDYAEVGTTPQPQYFDKTVEEGTTYYYVLQAVAGAEVSANSDERSVVIPGQKRVGISPPTWATAALSSSTEFGKTVNRVGLKWNKPASGTAIAYNLYRSTVSGKDYAVLTSSSETQYVDSSVEAGKSYFYAISALDDQFQESKFSEEKQIDIPKEAVVVKAKKKKKAALVPLKTRNLFTLDNTQKLMRQPRGIDIDEKGRVYITDAGYAKVNVFEQDGTFVERFGDEGPNPGQFKDPSGITIGPDGDLYVADQENGFINVFRTNGTYVKTINLNRDPKLPPPKPYSLAFHPKDGRIYAVDYMNMQVQILDPDGKWISTFGNKYDDAGKVIEPKILWWPLYCKFTDDGRLLVTDGGPKVTIFDSEGKLLVQFGERGSAVGTFMYLSGLDIDQGRKWVFAVDKTVNTIQVFDLEGNFKYALSNPEGKGGMGVGNPNGIKLLGDKIFVVENLAQRFSIFQILWNESPPPYEDKEAN